MWNDDRKMFLSICIYTFNREPTGGVFGFLNVDRVLQTFCQSGERFMENVVEQIITPVTIAYTYQYGRNLL